jgi:hypothetical protein
MLAVRVSSSGAIIKYECFSAYDLSVLISFKIGWMIYTLSPIFHESKISPAFVIVVESGAIYSIISTIALVTYMKGDWVSVIFLFNVSDEAILVHRTLNIFLMKHV